METALLKADGGTVRVTVIAPYGELNWRVRLDEECSINGGRTLPVGHIYIAGKSQLQFQKHRPNQAVAPGHNGGIEQ